MKLIDNKLILIFLCFSIMILSSFDDKVVEKDDFKIYKTKILGAWGEDDLGNANFAFYSDSIYYPDPNLWYKYSINKDTISIQREDNMIEKLLILKLDNDSLKLLYFDYDIVETYKRR